MIKLFNGKILPDWLDRKLKNMSPDPNVNHIIDLLLEDYIKRNKPCNHSSFTTVTVWDSKLEENVSFSKCIYCNEKV